MTMIDVDARKPEVTSRGYRLRDPVTDKMCTLTRATTIAKAPEDQGGLIKWGQRMVTLGLGRRADLVSLAASADPTDKRAIAKIASDAEEAGGAASGRNIGTAVHAAVESYNRDGVVMEHFADQINLYRAALEHAGLTPVPELTERICVRWEDRIAGTFDMVFSDRDGRLMIGDAKTGSVGYPASFAIQMAIYQGADQLVVAGTDDTYEDMPALDPSVGIIVHLPPGGPCTLWEIDLEAGRRGLAVALDVRRWRSEATAKNLLTPTKIDGPVASNRTGTVDVTHSSPPARPESARRKRLQDATKAVLPAGPGRGLHGQWRKANRDAMTFDGSEASMWRCAAGIYLAAACAPEDDSHDAAAALFALVGIEVQPTHAVADALGALTEEQAKALIGHSKIALPTEKETNQ